MNTSVKPLSCDILESREYQREAPAESSEEEVKDEAPAAEPMEQSPVEPEGEEENKSKREEEENENPNVKKKRKSREEEREQDSEKSGEHRLSYLK